MKTSKKVEITIWTDRRLVIRGSVMTRGWCPGCRSETDAVSLETAGSVAEAITVGLGEPMVTSNLHLLPGGEGRDRVCLRSLLEMVRRKGESAGSSFTDGLTETK